MLIRVLAALPLALVLMLFGSAPAATSEGCGPTGLFNPCAELDMSQIDDLRPTVLADAGVRLVR